MKQVIDLRPVYHRKEEQVGVEGRRPAGGPVVEPCGQPLANRSGEQDGAVADAEPCCVDVGEQHCTQVVVAQPVEGSQRGQRRPRGIGRAQGLAQAGEFSGFVQGQGLPVLGPAGADPGDRVAEDDLRPLRMVKIDRCVRAGVMLLRRSGQGYQLCR